jgi:metal-responsive CopG/Arc/MetJ family transcriptional regulator
MVRINAILREDIVEELDSIAREEHKNRSELLRVAAEKLIAEHRLRREEELRRARLERSVATQERLREKSEGWDGVAEVRKWREGTR